MKKILSFLAMTAAILAVSVSCNKPNDDDEEEEGGGGKYEAPIKIDGDFSDWAKITGFAEAKTAADATKTALKLVRVYADEMFVFVYFEWDKDQVSFSGDDVPFHCYINVDGDASTGGFGDEFSDACTDVMFEGFLYSDGKMVSYTPGVFKWVGETNGTGWENCWEDLGEFNNLTAGAGIEGKYEFQIARELLPKKLADKFSIGFDIQQSWDSVGILPNATANEDNPGGLAPSLQVTTKK
jgi:hypothetical protein